MPDCLPQNRTLDRTLNQPQRHDKTLMMLIRRVLKEKFDAILKLLFTEGKVASSRRLQLSKGHSDRISPPAPESRTTARNHVLQERVAPATPRAELQTPATLKGYAISLVKATVPPVHPLSPASARATHEAKESGHPHYCLAGLCVLCVGGRAALYPAYRRFVEASGGRFLIYRGDRCDTTGNLPALLVGADAVICPVDCVSHASFFYVKQYCMRLGKPCALLERSGLPTFRRGIEILAAASSQRPGH